MGLDGRDRHTLWLTGTLGGGRAGQGKPERLKSEMAATGVCISLFEEPTVLAVCRLLRRSPCIDSLPITNNPGDSNLILTAASRNSFTYSVERTRAEATHQNGS